MIQADLVLISIVALLGGLFGGCFLFILRNPEDILLFIIPAVLGIFIFGVCQYYIYLESEKINQEMLEIEKQKLESFTDLSCDDMGDYILKQYVGGNHTFTEKLIPIFEKTGCKFTVSEMEIIN